MTEKLIGDILKGRPLHVLLLEDDSADAELCQRTLKQADVKICCEAVATLEEFAEKLCVQAYDVVLSDYHFAGWTGLDALRLLIRESSDIPFILVTGALAVC
jgi:two-component system, NarL family, sensor histidine kinase UhpB